MADMKKLLDVMNETTVSGSIAAGPAVGLGTQRRNQGVYSEETEDGTKAPDAPKAKEFGLWKNSVLAGAEQRDKKKSKKSIKENNSLDQSLMEGRFDNPISNAITRRIIDQRSDLMRFGPSEVMSAIDQVAEWVGDVDEIGSSDVAGWVKQVEVLLKTQNGQGITEESGPGLWANIHAKRERIKKGSGERMRKPGSKGAPKSSDFKSARSTNENSNYSDSMTDAEWEREYQREKSEKELARKEIEKNHKSQFKTKEEAIQYANDKLKTFKDSKIGMSVYAMPDGGFDVSSTARTAAGQKRSKLISDAGGKHLGTLGPRFTKHKMAEQGVAEGEITRTPTGLIHKGKYGTSHYDTTSNKDDVGKAKVGRPAKNIGRDVSIDEPRQIRRNQPGYMNKSPVITNPDAPRSPIRKTGPIAGGGLDIDLPKHVQDRIFSQQDFDRVKSNPGIVRVKPKDSGVAILDLDETSSSNVDEGAQYDSQYKSKESAIEYAKDKVKSFRDPEDGIEIWALPDGGFDVVHTMNSNGRNHVIKNGGKKLGTVGKRYKGVAEESDRLSRLKASKAAGKSIGQAYSDLKDLDGTTGNPSDRAAKLKADRAQGKSMGQAYSSLDDKSVAEAAKWRTHPDAHDHDTDGSPMPKGGIKSDPLSIRQGVSRTQSEKDPKSLAGKFGDKYAKKHGVPTKQLMKNIPLDDIDEQGVAENDMSALAGFAAGTVGGIAVPLAVGSLAFAVRDALDSTDALATRKARVDTAEIFALQRQIVSIHKMLGRVKTDATKEKYQDMLKQAYAVLDELKARQGNRVAEATDDIRSARVGDEIILKNPNYRGVIVKLGTDGEFSFKNESDGKRYRGNRVMIDRNLSQEQRYKEKSDVENKRFDDAIASDMERIHKSGALKKFGIGVAEGMKDGVVHPDDPWDEGWYAGHRRGQIVDCPYEKGTPEYKQWNDGYDEAQAQPNHYDESVDVSENTNDKDIMPMYKWDKNKNEWVKKSEDEVQSTIARVGQLAKQNKKISKVDELDFGSGQRQLNLAEENVTEEQLLAKELARRLTLFMKGKDNDLGTKSKDREILPKTTQSSGAMRETSNYGDLDEVAPPGKEDWIKSNKDRFKKEYGDKKGTNILYATAWADYNKKHGKK